MEFVEKGNEKGKTIMLLPGTCCNWQTNFAKVIPKLSEKYYLICVNYDGFDGSKSTYSDMQTITEKIENYIIKNFDGKLDAAIGSSLGASFVGQMIQRQRIHIDHGIFGSPDLDQTGKIQAKVETVIMSAMIKSFIKNDKRKQKTKSKLMKKFMMEESTADAFVTGLSKYSIESIKNEFQTDLLTHLENGIEVDNTKVHFIYASKMGPKYLKRYKKHFKNPEIKEFDMNHEQWLFGDERYTVPVLQAIDGFLE